MPKASVLLCTYRAGGIDLVFNSLAQQTLKDYELVFIDHHESWRRSMVEEYADALDIPLVYPAHLPSEQPAASQDYNKAIVHASGDLAVWICDYSWLPPNWLKDHWETYVESGRRAGAVGGTLYLDPPAVKTGLSPMILPNVREPISIFAEEIRSAGQVTELPRQRSGQDPRLVPPVSEWTLESGLRSHGVCVFYFKNEGVSLRKLLDVNGVNSDFDAVHLHTDSDLFVRLQLSGWRFAVNSKVTSYVVQVRGIMRRQNWMFDPTGAESMLRDHVRQYETTGNYRAPGEDLRVVRHRTCGG